ncbi:KN motif and ankyrin repeat domain-containing protein 4 isoform X2 [Rhineura floridana]|uniref:KN motif and ankyrin repeat domain-containing protein 4 isoform X2 n=1 Tax=Rhineura floridana TaxID=261503 RepID=UPI002AC856ED|nr:KN motif and ankyrin repeat domain-containing protein 4 isoform X2 [Rhineura floridana]XP_061489257.1 KN motif and ankyrin repeat domain-containing protein 4 isoform X2 [Rhineura floridana]XP_061489258.1 KN motif and ankyrin repeat domain-containing protein 4 isoform X2 [Rhineura floridana]
MENTNDDRASKAEDKDPPQSPYSLETPYGFHLDLDFLKYVDDIEKGNTIKRIPIHRKTKHPKYSTLPRNFSLPENGSKAYSSSPGKSFLAQRKASLGAEESTPLITATDSSPFSAHPNKPSYRKKALLIETVKQDPVHLEEETGNCRGRPQLLRASSMPATLPPSQDSEVETQPEASLSLAFLQSSDGKGLFSPVKESFESNSSKGSSENLRNMKEQISKAAQDSEKVMGQQEEAQLELVQQQTELPKERIQLSAPWQNHHLISQELLAVTESGEEECDATESNACPPSVQSGSASSGALECKLENQAQGDIELNICETVTVVLEEDEITSPGIRKIDRNLNLESLPSEELSKIIALKQHIAILEEQLNNKTEELEQIRVVLKQQDKEIKAKERSIEMLASSKAQLEEKLGGENTKEITPCKQTKNALQYHDAAVNTERVHERVAKEASDKGVNVPMESVGCNTCGVDNKNLHRKLFHVHHEMANVPVGVTEKDSPSLQIQKEMGQENYCSPLELSYNELKINEHIDNDNYQKELYNYGMQFSAASEESCSGVEMVDSKAGGNKGSFEKDFKQELNEEETHTEPKNSPADPIVGQYVKKIRDLLQEQWTCLEHGYPELASAIKHPASKLSSIQNQLVNSLNLLLSAYSTQTPTDKENSNTQYQQLEISPSTSLKSIMKKKDPGFHAGGNGTKKNLQFVGVNGGYETTSSEDSSCEESSSEGNSDSETERKCGSDGHIWGEDGNESGQTASGTDYCERKKDPEELEGTTQASIQHKTERFKPSADFLKGCQVLSKHLSEIRTTKDKLMRHVLSTICQEWFRISSRKSSGPEIVAAYLQEVEAIHPQLQNIIVNLADGNGNTALHYSVSHSNFRIVKLLLETGVCEVDHQNKAGYTAVMITPLASAETDEEMDVVTKLLKEGNVNIRASQGGQTALILGVSHDREDMVKALLSCGADVNLQDDAGLSPLMVASQYGNIEIVKLLLTHPSCDTVLTDKAGNSALSIALKAAHMEIAEFLRSHIQQSTSEYIT